jgi:hypothetical protein
VKIYVILSDILMKLRIKSYVLACFLVFTHILKHFGHISAGDQLYDCLSQKQLTVRLSEISVVREKFRLARRMIQQPTD